MPTPTAAQLALLRGAKTEGVTAGVILGNKPTLRVLVRHGWARDPRWLAHRGTAYITDAGRALAEQEN